MTVEVRLPRLAESISEAVLVQWLKEDGQVVHADEPIATLETDKAAVELPAEVGGVLRHARKVGEKVQVGDVIARIEEAPEGAVALAPSPAARPAAPAPRPAGASATGPTVTPATHPASVEVPALGPAVRRMVEEMGLNPAAIPASGPGGRLLKEDVQRHVAARGTASAPGAASPILTPRPTSAVPKSALAPAVASIEPSGAPVDWVQGEEERAVPMSRIRRRIAERLVEAQRTAAILTTFNEVDMGAVMDLRARFKEGFEAKHGVRLSFMSFFGRACVQALERTPEINAEIRGGDIVYKRAVHLGIAVQTPRGLVVPVVRDADRRGFADLEREIARLAAAGRENRLTLAELSGGTFTISNGGVFGSLLSTPILNPPQSGILGMHKIEKRPVVVDDQIVIRPMMYLALSYDHRIVDGEQAVTFLVGVKQRLEDPERMLLDV